MALYGSGAVALLSKDAGSANSIQGARATGSPIYGGRLTTGLPTNYPQLAGDGIAQITQPPTGGSVSLTPNSISHAHAISAASVTTAGLLSTASLAHSHSIGTPNVNSGVAISALSLTHSHTLGAAGLSGSGALAAAPLSHAHSLAQPATSTGRTVAANSLTHAHSIAQPSLATNRVLAAIALEHAHSISAAGLSASLGLAVDGIVHPHVLTPVDLSTLRLLSVQSISHAHQISIATLPRGWSVFPAAIDHSQTLSFDQGSWQYRVNLTPTELTHAQPFAAPVLQKGSTLGLTAELVWQYEIVPGITAAQMLHELWLMHGLDKNNPLVVAPAARTVALIEQVIDEQAGTVTVTRQ